jgi:hypothetical protein
MVDGFWIGWLMDREAYSLEEAAECVSDWVLGLFGERPAALRRPPARRAAKPKAARAASSRKIPRRA